MPVTFEIVADSPFAVVTFAGWFTVEATETALAAFRAQGGQQRLCIIEFDRPAADFRVENIKRLCTDMMPKDAGQPTAFVGNTDLSFELCETIVRFITRPGAVSVFRSRAEAERWLKQQAEARAVVIDEP